MLVCLLHGTCILFNIRKIVKVSVVFTQLANKIYNEWNSIYKVLMHTVEAS